MNKRSGSKMLNPVSRGAYVFRNQDIMNLADLDNNGVMRKTFTNACLLMRDAPALSGILGLNEFTGRMTVTDELPWSSDVNRQWTDADTRNLKIWLDQAGLTLSTEVTHEAAQWSADENKFHPVRDYLNGLEWDRKSRIDTWLTYYLGAEDSEYVRLVGRLFLISMVARIFQPGCQVDYMLVLEGLQGIGKSSFCRTLTGHADWYKSAPARLDGKDASQALRGAWLVEMAELTAVRKADVEALKDFLTRTEEKYRPPYGRCEIVEPRQCVFIGTTNESHYLKDPTGNRRFWPVKCTSADLAALKHDRDQIFAEAVAAYRAKELWYTDRETEDRLFKPEQDARYDEDEWQPIIDRWLATTNQEMPTTHDVAAGALGMLAKEMRGLEGKRIAACMKRLGFDQRVRRVHGRNTRVWVQLERDNSHLSVVS